MTSMAVESPAGWTVASLAVDPAWTFSLTDQSRHDLTKAVLRGQDPAKTLFDYRRADFDLGAAGEAIAAAFNEAKHGRGIALVRGLPRDILDEAQFGLLTWAIGLHEGVPRPQGKASQYISAVRDAGTTYRSAGGRGYSSNAELDFHTDSADVVALTCFNRAKAGGRSMVTSSVAAYHRLELKRADLAEALREPFYFSRQAEQADDETPFYPNPVFDACEGRLFSKWNRNRLTMAQRMEGVPAMSQQQREATDMLDDVLRQQDLMYEMDLQPGDMQILNNHVMLHSRTHFEDHEDPARKRLLFRLWIAPPDSVRLPESWKSAYRSIEPGTVRGGIIGRAYDVERQTFDRRQADDAGMRTVS